MDPDDREKTAFSTHFGLFLYNVMPFRLATTPATFMRLMIIVFSGMHYTTCLAYLDDIIIISCNFMKMLGPLDTEIERLGQANLNLKPRIRIWKKTSVNFLGHVISDKGISTDPEKLRRIKKWPRLHNPDKACSFVGYATYNQKFIKNYAHIVQPLNKLLIKERQFRWTIDFNSSFTTIKAVFAETITLAYSHFTKPFIVDCDASDFGISGMFSQTIRPGVSSLFRIWAASCQSRNGSTQLPAKQCWRSSIRCAISVATFWVEILQCVLTKAHSNGWRLLKSLSVKSLGGSNVSLNTTTTLNIVPIGSIRTRTRCLVTRFASQQWQLLRSGFHSNLRQTSWSSKPATQLLLRCSRDARKPSDLDKTSWMANCKT